MLKLCQALAGALAVAWLAGCGSTRSSTTRWARVPSAADDAEPPPSRTQAEPGRGEPVTPEASPIERRSVAEPAEVPRAITNGLHARWIPMEFWSKTCEWSPPQYQGDPTNLTCQVRTPNGGLTLSTGSQLASFEGTRYWLGYAPLSADGDLLVHHLDAQKNLEPLGSDPFPFPPANGTVVIDPGHGGQNTGTQSVLDRTFEKEWTLDWALRLAPLLAGNGWRVVLTRTNDMDLSLADRVSLADAVEADLFVSLHFNSGFPNTELAGAETFCLTPVGLPSTLTRDYEDDLTKEFPNNAHDRQNLRYAFRLHRALLDATSAIDRGVRRARFMGVLRAQNRPAVLLEAGYLSNPGEAGLIATPAYRQRLAQAVARALTTPDLLFTRVAGEGARELGAP